MDPSKLKLRRLAIVAAVIAGPIVTLGAVVWCQVTNIILRPEAYVEAPPTISRAIVDPAIGEPFAVMMIVAAVFLSIGIALVYRKLFDVVLQQPKPRTEVLTLWGLAVMCEYVAVVGMIIISQYRGEEWSQIHNFGSYLLFSGHGLGIALSGYLVKRIIKEQTKHGDLHVCALLKPLPRAAFWVGGFSIIYAAIYFTGKHLSDDYFFWQRLLQCLCEIFLLATFLRFLTRFLPFLLDTEKASI